MRLLDAVLRGAGLSELDSRMAWRVIALALACYALGFALFYPRVATNDDEAKYLRQAQLMAEGRTRIEKLDALTGAKVLLEPSQYPPGTAALMAPFVRVSGWRGAYVLPCLALLVAVWATGRWIALAGHSPAFALTMLSLPATLVLGRVAMSDVPSMAAAAVGLWLFWRGIGGGPGFWLAAGLVAGASTALRELNVLVFAPLFAGCFLRREWKCWALIAGGLAGLGVRLLASWLCFDDPFYVKRGFVLEPESFMQRLPLYLLGLLVLVPGGLAFALAYRGPRRPEIVLSVALYFVFFLLQPYGMTESSFAKRLVIALRYFLPLLPLIAFAMAEGVPRLVRRLAGDPPSPLVRRGAAAALALYGLGIVAASFLVHPAYQRWSATQAAISESIYEVTGPDSVLVTNWWATKKFTRELDRTFVPIDRDEIDAAELERLSAGTAPVFIALLDRSDSDYWRADLQRNAAFIEALRLPHALELDRQMSSTDRLRIWRIATRDGR